MDHHHIFGIVCMIQQVCIMYNVYDRETEDRAKQEKTRGVTRNKWIYQLYLYQNQHPSSILSLSLSLILSLSQTTLACSSKCYLLVVFVVLLFCILSLIFCVVLHNYCVIEKFQIPNNEYSQNFTHKYNINVKHDILTLYHYSHTHTLTKSQRGAIKQLIVCQQLVSALSLKFQADLLVQFITDGDWDK